MFNLSEYGHSFHGNILLIITLDDSTAFSILETVRNSSYAYEFMTEEALPACIPDSVYFRSEESWYLIRFHQYCSSDHGLSMRIHFVKPMYMATAQLLQYEEICTVHSSENEHTVCFMCKKPAESVHHDNRQEYPES